MEDFSLAHRDLFAADQELERALQDVGHLLALVRVHRHQRPLFEVDLRDHFALAGDQLAGNHLRHLLERDLVPPVQPYGLYAHGSWTFQAWKSRKKGAIIPPAPPP